MYLDVLFVNDDFEEVEFRRLATSKVALFDCLGCGHPYLRFFVELSQPREARKAFPDVECPKCLTMHEHYLDACGDDAVRIKEVPDPNQLKLFDTDAY